MVIKLLGLHLTRAALAKIKFAPLSYPKLLNRISKLKRRLTVLEKLFSEASFR